LLGPIFGTNKVEQAAFVARVSVIWITIVDTGKGILTGRFALPRCTNRSSIPSLLDEIQLIFKEFENIALIRSHGLKPPFLAVLINKWLAFRLF